MVIQISPLGKMPEKYEIRCVRDGVLDVPYIEELALAGDAGRRGRRTGRRGRRPVQKIIIFCRFSGISYMIAHIQADSDG